MGKNVAKNRSILNYFCLVFLLSIPFWILGYFADDLTKKLPIKLPISALMAFCPLFAAAILTYKQQRMQGVKELLKQAFDYKKIRYKKWYLAIIFLMPLTAILSFWYLEINRDLKPETTINNLSIILFFFVYFIGAIGEEIGWSGYITEPMQNKFGALKASIILGIIWAIWHIIPYYQAHQRTNWIVWQCIGMVFLRIIMVWIFNNAGKSVFAIILFHTMLNISPYLIPNYGSHYDPFIFCMLLMVVAIMIVFFGIQKSYYDLDIHKFDFLNSKISEFYKHLK